MTTRIVMLKYADPTALGDVGTPNGYIECRPTRRRNVDDTVVLPSRFSVRYGAALMNGDTEVRPATPGVAWAQFECTDVPATWGWTLVERTDRGSRLTVLIPDTVADDVPLTELEQVDPDSFDPVAPPDPAWLSGLIAETDARIAADAALQAAIDAVEASDVDSVAGLTGTVTAAALKTAINVPTDTVSTLASLASSDVALGSAIAAETTARIADVDAEETARSAAVSAEATTRANADTTLQANITAEASARATADTALDGRVTTAEGTLASLPATYGKYVQLAKNPDTLITGAITRNGDGLITSAPVVWPDGVAGVYAVDSIGSLGTVDAYHITHVGASTTTYTQPTVTRDSSGLATNIPAITVA